MGFKYLSKEILAGFDKYKYSSVDTSPISKYVTHPFWNWMVQFYPLWLAPNVITLAGFLLLILMYAVLAYYDYHFYASDNTHPGYASIPDWVWMLSAMCMFWAHTLDGTDGKQARRTSTSGPLGELFDHGLDSWATHFMPIGMYHVFGRGDHSVPPDRFFLVLLGVWITFITTHWEKYNSGILYLPWSYDASQLGMTGIYLAAFFMGCDIWKFDLYIFNIHLTSGSFMQIIFALGVIISVIVSASNIYIAHCNKTSKGLGVYEGMRPLIPTALNFLLFMLWMHYSSYDIIRRDPRLLYFACGAVFSNSTSRIIVNGMSNTRCDAFNWMLMPLAVIVVGVLTLNLGIIELYLLWAYTIFVTAAHLHYGCRVVEELAEHLHIYPFSVEKPPKQE